jgi:hypothetical protein
VALMRGNQVREREEVWVLQGATERLPVPSP